MIGVFGDSFTDVNPIELRDPKQGRLPWPLHLARLQNQQVSPHGHSATSTWWSYKRFLKHYKNYKTIVFGYSNLNRWPNINYQQYGSGQEDFVGPISHIFHADQINFVPDKMKSLAWKLIQAHPYLYDEQFNVYIYQTMFDSVNTLCRQNGIRIVNLMPFEDHDVKISLEQAHGPCYTNLLTISGWETCDKDKNMVFPEALKMLNRADRRFCHINPHNNRVLAQIISDALSNNTMGCFDLVKDPRWSYDPAHLQYLVDELT
jgi:hypothetical protein